MNRLTLVVALALLALAPSVSSGQIVLAGHERPIVGRNITISREADYWRALLVQQDEKLRSLVGETTLPSLLTIETREGSISAEELAEFLKLLPGDFVRGIERIDLVDRAGDVAGGFVWSEMDHAGRSAIRLNRAELAGATRGEVFLLTAHEIGHSHSPLSSHFLGLVDRIVLLDALLKRIDAGDRFRSLYVEELRLDRQKGESEGEHRLRLRLVKAIEYWADILTQYLFNHSILPREDRVMVEAYLGLLDAGFEASVGKIGAYALNADLSGRQQ